MKRKLLAAFLAVALIATMVVLPASAASFSDVDSSHWAAGAIERWAGYGVVSGMGDGTYSPEGTMTRAQFAQVLVNMFGYTEKKATTFTDVPADAWYADTVQLAVAAGIVGGYTDNTFRPANPVSFNEAAVMLTRALGLVDNAETSGANWDRASISVLESLGMIGEGADEHLYDGAACNRAVVAALANSIIGVYVNENTTTPITGEIKGVVLVVKGAKAEIKDATLKAPLVVDSADVTMTNVQAKDVLVEGKNASVSGDADTTVGKVSMSGTSPSVALDGTVDSIVIEEATTGAVATAPKVDSSKVTNKSTEDATVNNTTVEGVEAPAEEDNTGSGTTSSNTGTGTAPAGSGGVSSSSSSNAPSAKCKGTNAVGGAHNWGSAVNTVAPTCANDKVETYRCSNTGCGEILEETTKTTVAHSYESTRGTINHGEGRQTAVMINKSVHEYTCTVCNEKVRENHTTTTTGNTTACTYCNYSVTKGLATTESDATAHDHIYNPTGVVQGEGATCGAAGEKRYLCTLQIANEDGTTRPCTAYTKETIPATGAHTWAVKDGDAGTAATCATTGTKNYQCSVCGAEKSEILGTDKNNHKESGGTKVAFGAVTPTCTAAGKTAGEKCQFCDGVITQPADTPALGHSWARTGEGFPASEYVKVDAYKHQAGCTICHVANPDAEPANHNWTEGVCDDCEAECAHNWRHDNADSDADSTCTICALTCDHENGENGGWDAETGTCADCDKVCKHEAGFTGTDGTDQACDTCGWICDHSAGFEEDSSDMKCELCDWTCDHDTGSNGGWDKDGTPDGTCKDCGKLCTAHKNADTTGWDSSTGKCTTCGVTHNHTSTTYTKGTCTCGYQHKAAEHQWNHSDAAKSVCTICGAECEHDGGTTAGDKDANGVTTTTCNTCKKVTKTECDKCTSDKDACVCPDDGTCGCAKCAE